jgi:ATP-binding cassette subfamily F protein uup
LLVAEGAGKWQEYEGGITDWHAQRALAPTPRNDEVMRRETSFIRTSVPTAQTNAKSKLSFNERRELDKLPDEIDALEKEQMRINATLADGEIYRTDAAKAKTLAERLPQIDALLLEKMERWEALAQRV